jgi:hypothetical protein
MPPIAPRSPGCSRTLSSVVAVSIAVTCSTVLSSAASAHLAVLPVVRCPTTFAAGMPPRTPAHLTISSATATSGLAAYTNTWEYLLAPTGMRCSGFVAGDGGSSVQVWPRGSAEPSHDSRGAGLTLFIAPACASCRAAEACPFFAAFARSRGFPCSEMIPLEEQDYRLRRNITLFEDAPGVRGSGWPSGGIDPANGLVGIGEHGLVFRSTCTLPSGEHALCTTGLNYLVERWR